MLTSFKNLVGKKTKEDTQVNTYVSILENNPKNLNIRLKLGDLYAKLGDTAAAIREYTMAAVQYADEGYLVKAIAVNKIIVRLDPSRKEALDRLSDLYFQRGVAADPLVERYREAQKKQEEFSIGSGEDLEIPTIDSPGTERQFTPDTQMFRNIDQGPDLTPYLPQVPLLATLSEETRLWLQKHSTMHTFAANERILEQQGEPDALFVLLEGTAKIYTQDKEHQDTLLDHLKPGSFFGGTSLFEPVRQIQAAGSESHFAVVTDETCILLETPKPMLAALVKKEPDFSEALLMEYYKRKTSDSTLARVPLFSFLDPVERRKIAEHLSPVNIRKGVTIITEGDIGDSMYIIKSGQVGVYTTLMEDDGLSVIKTDQERLHLATLQEGDFFGEQALITNEPRSATIIALTEVQLFKFTKQDLAVVVKQYPRVGVLLKKYHQQRISDTLESLKSIW
ncbi:cyclic nucleotide-binding protein [Candidatus Vecturithrix granuli]|uniref:Cyclic nucleotide-binding protein n=1 Tax=Vecturithrix granuli TaxID=1499967 RepID=A0A081BYS3_VECG1|nr:cyclic nucleotide-binding protein [Candidatus Vecturithrix granuli]